MKKLLSLLLVFLATYYSYAQLSVEDLRCEYLENPIGLDVQAPRFGYVLSSSLRGQKQTAYRILVSSSENNLNSDNGDIWDSGKTLSDQSVQIAIGGKQLSSDTKYFWKVKVWDKEGKESAWSKTSFFTTGLLSTNDWKAKWIGLDKSVGSDAPTAKHSVMSARYLRKEPEVKKELKRATAFICGVGLYELYINGNKIGDAVLAPNLAEYKKRVYYNTYDVTEVLKKGKNAIGVILGGGRWVALRPREDPEKPYKAKFPKLLAQINLEYADGSKEVIISDESWKITTNGPIRANNEFDGEYYDATKEMPGWDKVGFNDAKWSKVQLVSPAAPAVVAQINPPIKVMETLKPVSVKEIKKGVWIYDMGQNMVGWVKIKVNGSKGTTVKLRFAETIKEDGSLYMDNLRSAKVTDTYVLKGGGEEVYEPRFVYHGFQYVELTGFPGTPDLNTIEGKVVHDAVETVGSFKCENDIMNKLHKNAYWGIRGNYRSIVTDCPQRDERQGWLGDRAMETKGEAFIFRNAPLYLKWLQDINDAQRPNGSIPDVAPTYWNVYNDDVTWPSAFIIIPYVMYQQFGDKEVIRRNYEAMKKWIDLMVSYTDPLTGLISKDAYGDWCVPPENLEMIWTNDPKRKTASHLLATAYMHFNTKLMGLYAGILGKGEDMSNFNALAEKYKNALNNKVFNPVSMVYDNNSLSSSIIPLAFDMVPAEYKTQVFNNAVSKLVGTHQVHVATGLIGGQWLMKTLSDLGRPDLALKLATNTSYPSWGYSIEKGATTIWELWNGDKANPAMNSRNHVMLLGDVITWMYENVGGIKADLHNPGFKKIIMKPDLFANLKFAAATHRSLYGDISSSWKVEGNTYNLNIKVPVNTTALVYVPANNETDVKESGNLASKAQGVIFLRSEGGRAIYEVGAGTYNFTSTFTMPKEATFTYNPVISPGDTSSTNAVTVTITHPEGNPIYYTLDGSEPNQSSNLYKAPFIISNSGVVKAKALKDKVFSSTSIANIDIYDSKVNGWNYKYYQGNWKMLPDFSKEKVIATGKINDLILSKVKKRADQWGAVFRTVLEIDKEGLYTFFLNSDDGSRLRINGKQILINDGEHGAIEGFGNEYLKPGTYEIEIEFFDSMGGETLEFYYQIEGGNKMKVPVSKLFPDKLKK